MFDCANVEMRELLPELAAGTVDASTRARVEAHVAECAECASELETLRLVRSAYAEAPSVDVRRVVSALPKPPAAQPAARRTPAVKRWIDWRIAAALATITVGGLSLAVTQRFGARDRGETRDTTRIAQTSIPKPAVITPAERATTSLTIDTGLRNAGSVPPASRASGTKAELSFGGGMSDLDDTSLQQLLGALDEIDRAPVAPPAEPDRSPLLPIIRGSDQ